MKLTVRQKRQIAKIAVEKSEGIENGTLHVYYDGDIFSILVGMEYRDEKHEHVCTLRVWNENKPYTVASFIRQIDNYLEMD